MKQILVIRDPECEVGFDVLSEYCSQVQRYLGNEVQVLPIWPHGEVELIGDKRKMKLLMKDLKDIISEFEDVLKEGENAADKD